MLTCYEDSVGPTNRLTRFAEYACNFTQAQWQAGNFTTLVDCLMKISVQDGMNAFDVRKSIKYARISKISYI